MHRAKTPKLLTSILAVFALVFGSAVVALGPSNAAPASDGTPSGCQSSNWQPQKCGGQTITVAAANLDDYVGSNTASPTTFDALSTAQQTCATSPREFFLYAKTDTSYGTPLTSITLSDNSVISFNGNTASFSYTPTGSVTLTNYVIVKSCNGNFTRYSMYVQILATATPQITPAYQEIETTVGQAMNASTSYSVTRFTGAPTFTISPALPANLSINPVNGVVSGTYAGTATEAVYRVTATYASASQTAEADIKLIFSAVTTTNTGGGGAATAPDRKVTICHRTHATTNPYVRITVDYNSVNKKSGHQGHDEIFAGQHVFTAGIYVRAKDKDWGDIIPKDPTGLNRWQPLNWTTLGAQIYNGTVAGCPSFDPVKYYNALREAGVPEKKIKQEIADIETEQAEAEPTTKKSNVDEIKYTGDNKKTAEEDGDKVTLCHRTNSVTNPYVRITVAASSVYKNAGHYGHDEIYNGHHVFDSSVDYPNNKKDWGDIIPADPTGKNRWAALNMTTLGKKIYDGTVEGCAEKSLQTLYNELREEGKSKKEIVEELEKSKNTDVDPKDLDEIEYTGDDPDTKKSEPKEPADPSDPTNNPNPVKIPDQSLSGIVWLDINKDGLKDPNEPLMKNIKLYVVQITSIPAPVTPANLLVNATVRRSSMTASNGFSSTGSDATIKKAAVSEVLTDANGFYLFPSLGAGDWQVTTTVPDNLYVTYDSHESSDGEIITTVPVASHAFTWVGLVGDTPKDTLDKLAEILNDNPNALPLSQIPPELKPQVIQARAAVKAGVKPPVISTKPAVVKASGLAETGSNDLVMLFFGVLLMLSAVALRLARTKQ